MKRGVWAFLYEIWITKVTEKYFNMRVFDFLYKVQIAKELKFVKFG